MRKFQCLLFVLKRSHICYYIICTTVPLNLICVLIELTKTGFSQKVIDANISKPLVDDW